ncbi:MAG: radical SAM protein [Verrucomicrobia bacterium]|nr:radical SAM protein [Verrucomicrobiota bacterium]
MSDTLVVNEIFLSLQGESTWAGLPCVFVRLTACHLRCSYCDTAYAFTEGRKQTLNEVLARVRELAKPFQSEAGPARLPLVEVTGGEPLLQPNSLVLLKALCDDGFTVLLETSGTVDLSGVDARVRRIMDLKCPASGESDRNHWPNLRHLRHTDEIKFVIASQEDYHWARKIIAERNLARLCPVLFSWAVPLLQAQQNRSLNPIPAGHTPITRQQLAERLLADALPVRFQVQMHKIIWPADARGV